MEFNPLGDSIVAIPEKMATQSKSGILLGNGSQREQPRIAKVVAIGPKVKEVKIGDRIMYQAFANVSMDIGSDEYITVREEFVLLVINEKENDCEG